MDSTKLLDDEPGVIPYETMELEEDLSCAAQDEIAERAYSYWEERGFQGGSQLEDWLRAEQELKKRYAE
jgi:hypothetical protein